MAWTNDDLAGVRSNGVLKVRDGTDWRKVGCGGSSSVGRLRMQLPDGSWVREVCDNDTVNKLSNPGAESGTTGYSVPFDTLSTTSSPIHSGSAAFSITAISTTGGFELASNQVLRVVAGKTYKIAGWLRTSGWSGTAGLVINWMVGSSPLSQTIVYPTDVIDGSGWVYVSATAVAPATADRAQCLWDINVSGSPTAGSAYYDDLEFIGPAVGHPLKIEDPSNPGTWITVACMVPV